MTAEKAAPILLLLAPVWPLLAAGVLSFGRRPRSQEEVARIDNEFRFVAAAAALLSCGSLLAALLIGPIVSRAPEISERVSWLVLSAATDVPIHFQVRMDALSGPAAIAAALLSFVAVIAQRRERGSLVGRLPPYRALMGLLCSVLIVLLANDLVLLTAALVVSEVMCQALVRRRLSWARGLTLLPFIWIVLQWIVGFRSSDLFEISLAGRWVQMGAEQPIFTLVSGLCLLVCVVGRCGLYPFCVDVDRVYDEAPGRLFWFGCLGSWIPAQYLLLRFWPVLGVSPLGVPSLASIAVLLTILSAWLAVTRPHRAGTLAMIGSGMMAVQWTALGSGHLYGQMIAACSSLSLMLLFGGLVILVDAQGWLNEPVVDRRGPGRRTLWVILILLASGIGVQNAWEVTFESSRSIEVVDGEVVTESLPTVPAAIPIVMIAAHSPLWLIAAFVLSPILLGMRRRVAETGMNEGLVDVPAEAETSSPWLTRRLCGGLVLVALLWGPVSVAILRQREQNQTADLLRSFHESALGGDAPSWHLRPRRRLLDWLREGPSATTNGRIVGETGRRGTPTVLSA